jgi:hypothetical protein
VPLPLGTGVPVDTHCSPIFGAALKNTVRGTSISQYVFMIDWLIKNMDSFACIKTFEK